MIYFAQQQSVNAFLHYLKINKLKQTMISLSPIYQPTFTEKNVKMSGMCTQIMFITSLICAYLFQSLHQINAILLITSK